MSFSYSAADAQRVLVVLLGCELVLLLGYVVTRIVLDGRGGPLAVLLDLDGEGSIPAWFSSVQLAAIGFLLLAQTRLASELRGFLLLLALCFLYLSVDEAAAIHEKIIPSAERYASRVLLFVTFNGDHRAWMLPYVVLACIGALFSWRYLFFVWRNMRREGYLVAAGLGLFAMGGIGIEVITFHVQDRAYYSAVAVEEFLEMSGMSVVLYGFMLGGLNLHAMSLPLVEPPLVVEV